MGLSRAKTTLRPVGSERALAETVAIGDSRDRLRQGMKGRERVVTLALAASFLAAAVACFMLLPSGPRPSALVVLGYVAAYAVLSRIEFEIGPGSAVPTVLVLVPMLFVLPCGLVPACVALGLAFGGTVDLVRNGMTGERLAVLLCSSWHSVGPAVVVGTLAPGAPSWGSLDVYALALLAQFAFDGGATVVRQCAGRGVKASSLVRPLGLAWLVDCALAPAALVTAFAAAAEPPALIGVLPLAGLLHVLVGERRKVVDDNVVLGRAVESAARAALSDPLTGIGNRRAWTEAFDRAARADAGVPSSLLLIDLNGLKEINDTFGHDAGDRVIQALAKALVRALPGDATIARVGGDEFAVLIERAGETEAATHAAAVLQEVSRTTVAGIALSAAVGRASVPPCPSLDIALRVADEELYRAKARSSVSRTGGRLATRVSGP